MWSLKTDSSHNLFFKKRQPGCQNFQCDPSGTLPFDGDSFSREKLARWALWGIPSAQSGV